MKLVYWFLQDDRGATAVEYGVLAACLGIALIAAFNITGGSINSLFTGVNDKTGTILTGSD